MGYIGQSMSVRAAAAYEGGAQPRSKWTKNAIIEAYEGCGVDEETIAKLETYSAEVLRRCVLSSCGWHHTGKFFQETDFYDLVDVKELPQWSEFDDCKAAVARYNAVQREVARQRAQETAAPVKAKIVYEEWEGSRKHPHLETYTSLAVLRNGWAFLPGGSRKRLSGQHVRVCARYERAPRGTADKFAEIMKFVR